MLQKSAQMLRSPRQYNVFRGAHASQQAIDRRGATPARLIRGGHDEQIEIAIAPCITASVRAKQDDAPRMETFYNPIDHPFYRSFPLMS